MDTLPPSKEDSRKILAAIEQAELATSGEIRVHFENHCKKDVLDRAAEVFAKLHMHETDLRNGVLFYIAIKDHKFAILGDKGINKVVPDTFWDDIKEHMQMRFKEQEFTAGICEGIRKAGQQLKTHFPYQTDDKNELSDDISYEDN
ncbi:MAG: TPM domain-containing protein [Candidatus Cyclobacteriaceae bacterium M2_1C_046]